MKKEIEKLAQKNVFIGTSSWKYPGWKNLVYHEKYRSEKAFEEDCLKEYAGQYMTVGVDHTFYAWPSSKTMEKYAAQTPDDFKFGLKATEKLTIFKYPNFPRYGKDAGKQNENFLKAELFLEKFISGIEPIEQKVGVIMFEFSHFYPGMVESGSAFVKQLGSFLKKIRKECNLPIAIEIRNSQWTKTPYFEMLADHEVGHVFNSWTKMPPIGEQLSVCGKIKLPLFAARLLLEPGKKYEEAVEAYSPYDKLQNPLPSVRKDSAQLVLEAIERKVPAYVFVNNRLEGSAPKTIDEILKLLK